MASYIFQKISQEGKAQGIMPGAIDARDWFRDRATSISRVDIQREMRNTNRLYPNIGEMDIGRMYMFFYDPKTKETLPYYDRFPLIFMIDKYKDGFLGMNLHYLPPLYRARLMDALYSIERNDSQRESKKLRLTYGLLNSAAKYKYFKPTVKRYLYNHVRSRYLYVPYEEWDIALMLPTERFMKGKKNEVWKESKQLIRRA